MKKASSKVILVTGGLGFIGSNFIRYLLKFGSDYEILVLDAMTYAGNLDNLPEGALESGAVKFWHGNVCNAELVDTLVSQSNIVIHFAAETHVTRSIHDNLIFFETDVIGTHVVANAVLKHEKTVERFIHISTSEVYGSAIAPTMTEDSHPLVPQSPYAAAKLGADRLVYSYWATYKIPAVIVRPFNNFGPYQHLEKVIPRFITSCLLNEPLTIHGDGSNSRDWLFVEDTCAALFNLLEIDIQKIQGQAINLGTGRSITIENIAKLIISKTGRSQSLIQYLTDRPGQVVRHAASIEKARRILDWQPSVEFEEGLDRTIEWYEANRKWWEKQLWLRQIPIMTAEGKVEYH